MTTLNISLKDRLLNPASAQALEAEVFEGRSLREITMAVQEILNSPIALKDIQALECNFKAAIIGKQGRYIHEYKTSGPVVRFFLCIFMLYLNLCPGPLEKASELHNQLLGLKEELEAIQSMSAKAPWVAHCYESGLLTFDEIQEIVQFPLSLEREAHHEIGGRLIVVQNGKAFLVMNGKRDKPVALLRDLKGYQAFDMKTGISSILVQELAPRNPYDSWLQSLTKAAPQEEDFENDESKGPLMPSLCCCMQIPASKTNPLYRLISVWQQH
jgi:hypothetical protein